MIRAIAGLWRPILIAILIVYALYVLRSYGQHQYEQGRAEVQAVFDAYRAEQVLAVERQQQADTARAQQASQQYQEESQHAQQQTRIVTQYVDRIVTRPVYRSICLDDDGLRIARHAIAGTAPAEPASR